MWMFENYPVLKSRQKPFFLSIFLLVAVFCSVDLRADALVISVIGKVDVSSQKLGNIKQPLQRGNVIDSTDLIHLAKNAFVVVMCGDSPQRHSVKLSGPVSEACAEKNSSERTFRSDKADDIARVLLPGAGKLGGLSEVIWVSSGRAQFKLKLSVQQENGLFQEVYQKDLGLLAADANVFSVQRAVLPEDVLHNIAPNKTYQLQIVPVSGRAKNRRTLSGAQLFRLENPVEYSSILKNLEEFNKVEYGDSLTALIEGFYLAEKGFWYDAFLSLSKVKDPAFIASATLLSADVLRISGSPYEVFMTVYKEALDRAVSSPADPLTARRVCSRLQEKRIDTTDYWQQQIELISVDPKTKIYCQS